MYRSHLFIQRALKASLCGAALLVCAGSVQAEIPRRKVKSEGELCVSAYKTAQERQMSGDLVAASRLYGKCSDEVCGSALWQECVAREIQLHSEVPSVVLMVSDHNGEPLVDVKVEMDGHLLTSRLDGLALPINPGTHEFLFATASEAFAPQKITLAVGDRNHLISAAGEAREAQAQQ